MHDWGNASTAASGIQMNFEVHTNVMNVAVCQALKMWELWLD